MPRSRIGFGQSTVRRHGVSTHPCVLIAVASRLCLPLSYLSLVHGVLCRVISVDYCRTMYHTALACIDIRYKVSGGVRACLDRAFELCEQIRAFNTCCLSTLAEHLKFLKIIRSPPKVIPSWLRRPVFPFAQARSCSMSRRAA
jgi:hypothetical protein